MIKIEIRFIAIIYFSAGCNETSTTNTSVNGDFKKTGNGTMTTTIENAGAQLNLTGNLDLTAGDFYIYLSNPSGDTIYSESYKKNRHL